MKTIRCEVTFKVGDLKDSVVMCADNEEELNQLINKLYEEYYLPLKVKVIKKFGLNYEHKVR